LTDINNSVKRFYQPLVVAVPYFLIDDSIHSPTI